MRRAPPRRASGSGAAACSRGGRGGRRSPCAVGEHLDLDVAGAADEALDEQPPVAEGLLGLARWPTSRRRRAPSGPSTQPHAAPAAARRRLEQDRVADLARRLARASAPSSTTSEPSPIGDAELARRARARSPCRRCGASPSADGPTKAMPASAHARRQLGALGEEAVAGVQRVAAGDRRGGDEAVDVEVALGRGGRADADDAVGELGAEAAAVGLGDGEDGLEALVEAGPDDPHGDLAAVGDEHARAGGHGRSALGVDGDQRLRRTRPSRRSRPGSR